ncbi:kelch-like protein 20 isoform X2 [Neocloeon triangulifer]|uniref:kelch-like protein 20 isoform X2 n=1 Tax=Neocloeon triangulifer TaxID=2078957 RepID=UPI00286EC16F|nr:kelch-like protein 20 isoform X2 [Neocloeon triangulifer]
MRLKGAIAVGVLCILTFALKTECARYARETVENGATQAPEHDFNGVADFHDIIKTYKTIQKDAKNLVSDDSAEVVNKTNWRNGKTFAGKLGYMLSNSKLTDCVFIVGPDNNTEKIEAHSVILAAASPVFEMALENSTSLRVKEWQPSEFKKILSFIYSGDLCFDDFDEACTLLNHASSLELDGANEAARGYVFNYMYPNRLWNAYQCAKQASDEKLLNFTTKLISAKTTEALKDRKFNELSQADLATFVARGDLNVESEVEIFEAVTRWGLTQVLKDGLTPSPELMREKIGPEVIKNIRFLTMTGAEFSRMHTNAKLLNYEEGLAVLLNINSPGVLDLPKTLCPLTEKRENVASGESETFVTYGIGGKNSVCSKKGRAEESGDYYDLYTTTIIPNTDQWNILGIQIPKSLEAQADCLVEEHFDILILNSQNEVVETFFYNAAPLCTTDRFTYNGGFYSRNDGKVINLKFNKMISIPSMRHISSLSSQQRYKIKIVFRDQKTYPRSVSNENRNSPSSSAYYLYHSYWNFLGTSVRYRLLDNSSFVYAIMTQN